MLLGLVLGEVPVPLPGGATFRLGSSGGPLLVALILGRLQRTRGIVWQLPYSANLTLRNLGLSLFAIGVGLRAGYLVWTTIERGEGLAIVLVGALATIACGGVILIGGRL
ncbi:MAG: transporter, partial [Armatimonadota bacterium]